MEHPVVGLVAKGLFAKGPCLLHPQPDCINLRLRLRVTLFYLVESLLSFLIDSFGSHPVGLGRVLGFALCKKAAVHLHTICTAACCLLLIAHLLVLLAPHLACHAVAVGFVV